MGMMTNFIQRLRGEACPFPEMVVQGLCITNAYKRLAMQSAINLVGATISQAKFEVYEKGKKQQNACHYALNVEANVNMSAPTLWKKVACKLLSENEALVIIDGDAFYLADSFIKTERSMRESLYKMVTLVGGFKFDRAFHESEVLYIALDESEVSPLVLALTSEFESLVAHSMGTYKRSNALRGVVEIPSSFAQTREKQDELQQLIADNFKSFTEATQGAILPLTSGIKYQDLTNHTYKNGSDSRDIRALIDDVYDFVATSYRIPPQLLKGTLAESDKAWESYMTSCINPIVKTIEAELNRKLFGAATMQGDFIHITTSHIKDVSLKDMGAAIDLLTRNGVNTIDDNLEIVGRAPVGGEIGKIRPITKNLDAIENFRKGGTENEEKTDYL